MDAQVLIDSIVRQTTVLIAQLSSAAGVRAPLAHVADEVFLNLSRELEQQGLSRKVVADMFGMALRGYQRRVRRLSESVSERGTTLWQAILDFLESEAPVSRRRVLERFQYDDAAAVAAVLADLTSSGLVSRTGAGESAFYSVTQEQERAAIAKEATLETASALVWLEVCRTPAASVDELALRLALSQERVEESLIRLETDGRIRTEEGRRIVDPLIIPVGAESGWEVAVFDHFQAMCIAIAAKIHRGTAQAQGTDTTGGQTMSFEIDDDHPHKEAVLGLLERTRAEANELWHQTEEHNRAHPKENRRRVSFYVGQVEVLDEEGA